MFRLNFTWFWYTARSLNTRATHQETQRSSVDEGSRPCYFKERLLWWKEQAPVSGEEIKEGKRSPPPNDQLPVCASADANNKHDIINNLIIFYISLELLS